MFAQLLLVDGDSYLEESFCVEPRIVLIKVAWCILSKSKYDLKEPIKL